MNPEQIWREKSDEDLVEAGERLFEFTAEGERIIRAELHRRGLPDPAAPVDYCGKCGRGIYAAGSADSCENCGEPFAAAVRAKLTQTDELLIPEVVYRSRFAHEIELVIAELEQAGILVVRAQLRYVGVPAVDLSEHTVAVAASDAARAREIIEGLPVSHSGEEETLSSPPLNEP